MKRFIAAAFALGLLLICLGVPASAMAAGPSLFASGGYTTQVGSLVIPAGTTHNGNIALSAGNVMVAGTVRGNVSVSFGQVDVSGRVTGNISVGIGQLVLAKGARVGNTSVGIGQIITLPPGAPFPVTTTPNTIQTNIFATRFLPSWASLPIAIATSYTAGLLVRIVWWLIGLAAVLILTSAFPRGLEIVERDFVQAPATGFAWGFLILLAAPPASIVLALTIVGIPLVLVLWALLFAAKVVGYAAISLYVGRAILSRFDLKAPSIGIIAVVGTATFFLVGSVPIIGALVDFVVTCASIGVVARTGFGTGRPWFRKPAPSTP